MLDASNPQVRGKALAVALKVIKAVNGYKEGVGLPLTPSTPERLDGIIDGVINRWNHPKQSSVLNHRNWYDDMVAKGWKRGDVLDEEAKTHPALVTWLTAVPYQYQVNNDIFIAIVDANPYVESVEEEKREWTMRGMALINLDDQFLSMGMGVSSVRFEENQELTELIHNIHTNHNRDLAIFFMTSPK